MDELFEIYSSTGQSYGYIRVFGDDEQDIQEKLAAYLKTLQPRSSAVVENDEEG
jgi:hypothetical protein